jgi:hypothetical protein
MRLRAWFFAVPAAKSMKAWRSAEIASRIGSSRRTSSSVK